jgi:predicted MFS family arabinose efflux permease
VIFAYEEKVDGCGSRWSARGSLPLVINTHPYRQVLSDRRALAFSLAGFVARLPMSMTGIGIVLLVSLTTGSFGLAGSLTAAATVTAAVVAPLWGRATDRVGQARVLLVTVLINVLSVAVLVSAIELSWPLPVSFVAAVGIGVGFSLAGSSVRARWTLRLNGSPLLHTAFALEAMSDEIVFIIGPVLVTFLATALHPALGISVSAVIGLIGAVALAAQRSTQPPTRSSSDGHGGWTRIPWRVLLPVAVACSALGMIFGGMEVNIVAFAKEAGVLPYAGLILIAWSFGSLVAGAVTGAITWHASPARRFRVGATLLALSLLPLPFISHPVGVATLLIPSGMAIAPTLIASVGVTQSAVDQSRLTEALAWSSTGLAGGVAIGAAAVGHVIDSWGAQAGFVAVAIAGLLLTLSVLFVRGPHGSIEPTPHPVAMPVASPELTNTPAADSSHPQVGTRS